MYPEMDQKIDIDVRLARVQRLRAAVTEPGALEACAQSLIDAAPPGCTHVVAFSPEAHAVAAAASVLAVAQGRPLSVHLASHVAPLNRGPDWPPSWEWMNAEEALGLGRVREWVVRWAEERGGASPTAPRHGVRLAQVA